MGWPRPRLMASTPAMNVVLTAPMPGIKIPSLPSAGAILVFPVVDNYDSPWVARGWLNVPSKGDLQRLSYAILTCYVTARDEHYFGHFGG